MKYTVLYWRVMRTQCAKLGVLLGIDTNMVIDQFQCCFAVHKFVCLYVSVCMYDSGFCIFILIRCLGCGLVILFRL